MNVLRRPVETATKTSRWLRESILLSKVLANGVKSLWMLGVQKFDKLKTTHPVH